MVRNRRVYLLDPSKLPPETIAVTFAKTSRSPQSFAEIAAELTDEKSAEFHEKWVVGYGHASVAEHAVLHIAVENISRLAVETLESCRLASYTEKSTRYQKWDASAFHTPAELDGTPFKSIYIQTIEALFQAYQEALPVVRQLIEKESPLLPAESEAAWERRIRSCYVDVCRFYLPAAALANVGITINARALEHLISKLLSNPLEEVRLLGREIKETACAHVPTLVKYANPLPNLVQVQNNLESFPIEKQTDDWCQLIYVDPDPEERILAALLYRFENISYANSLLKVKSMTPTEQQKLAELLLQGLEKHAIPLRELEYANFTFDVTIDQGAYFELKRHRMMTQTPQALTTRLGYALPLKIVQSGLTEHFNAAMQAAQYAYERLAEWNPHIAAYVVPNAYNRRVLLQFNLRSGEHLLALRSAPNAHFSLRRLSQRMAEQIRVELPLLGPHLRVEAGETWQQIEKENFAQL